MTNDTERFSYVAVNQRNQPVELHCEHRVVVLPPFGTARLSNSERNTAQLNALERKNLISIRESATTPRNHDASRTTNALHNTSQQTPQVRRSKRRKAKSTKEK